MAVLDVESVKVLMEMLASGKQMAATTKSLAVLDIPLDVAVELKIVETLTPLSGSPLLSGAIHEILKKLEGKKEKEETSKKAKLLRRTSSKKSVKARRPSARKSKENEEKENEKVATMPRRLFRKQEPKKKESAIWKRITKSKQ